ncbi:TPA: hypothetical protein HA336_03380 [Methanopyrus kandleri]|uniref:Rhodanese domain-containing protein n=1 Tax=Methanopyrus kandleri TaxID=2320 RepID=A0A832THK5_9EURY|nr:hypothetical protein [Methanopyrus kandleri]
MRDHVVVCGFGRVGAQAAGRLRAHGFDVVVVDTSKERVERARREGFGVPYGRGEPHRPSDAGACGCGQGQVRGGLYGLGRDQRVRDAVGPQAQPRRPGDRCGPGPGERRSPPTCGGR